MKKRRSRWKVAILLLVALVLGAREPLLRGYYRVRFEPIILREARRHQVSPHLIAAVIFSESRFRSEAISEVGAIGLMQLMPATAAEMAKKEEFGNFRSSDLFDPEINIRLGSRYLAELESYFPREEDVLAAYNAGPSSVWHWQKTGGRIPYGETRHYVAHVKHHRQLLEHLYPGW